eukprot:469644_1
MSNRILNRSYRQNQFQQRTHLRYKRHKIQFFFLPAALINNIHSFLLSITYIPNLPWNQTANIHAETVKNVNKLFWYTHRNTITMHLRKDCFCVLCYIIDQLIAVIQDERGGDATAVIECVNCPNYASMLGQNERTLAASLSRRKAAIKPLQMTMISRTEFEKHHHLGDCWIEIEGKVYDVSEWMRKHPGGERG